MALRFPGGRQRAGIAQAPARAAPQRVHMELLRLAVGVGVAAVVTRISPCQAEITPVRGRVQGAAELRRVNETLGDQHRVPVPCLPVVAESAQHRGHRKGRETPKYPLGAEHHKPGVVRDQMQTPVPQIPRPANPAVPVPALERTRLPAGKHDPQSAPFGDVTKTTPGEPLEAEIVLRVHKRVPLPVLLRARKPHHHLGQRKPFRRRRENRPAAQPSVHAPSLQHSGPNSQQKIKPPEIQGRIVKYFSAWDRPGACRACRALVRSLRATDYASGTDPT